MNTAIKSKNRPDPRPAKTRRKVIKGAIEAMQVYDRLLPLADIAVLSDVSQQTVFKHFGTREGLYAAIASELLQQLDHEVGSFFDSHTALETLEFFLERLGESGMLPLTLIADSSSTADYGRRPIIEEFVRHLEVILELIVSEAGSTPVMDVAEIALHHGAVIPQFITDNRHNRSFSPLFIMRMILPPLGLTT